MTKYLIVYYDDQDNYQYKIIFREEVPAHSWLQAHPWDLPETCDVIFVAEILGQVSSVMVA